MEKNGSAFNTSTKITLPFTGLEAHNFVAWARQLDSQGITTYAKVIGREPITTSEVSFEGKVVEYRWNKYDRGITVMTKEGLNFKIGGTNTTSSISCLLLTLFIPKNYLEYPINRKDIWNIVESLPNIDFDNPDDIRKVEGLKLAVRLDRISERIYHKFYLQTPHRLHEIEDLLKNVDENFIGSRLEESEWASFANKLIDLCDLASPRLRVEIAHLLGLIATENVLTTLANLLRDPDINVRREASLSFRAMEDTIQEITSKEKNLVSLCINTVADALKDLDDDVRVYAAEDLGYFYNDYSKHALLEAIKSDPQEHVRWAAAVALGRYDKPEQIFHDVINVLSDENSTIVKRSTILSIGRMLPRLKSNLLEFATLANDVNKLQNLLVFYLKSDVTALSSYAAYAIGELITEKNSNIVGDLIDVLSSSTVFEVRCNVILSLSKLTKFILPFPERKNKIEAELWKVLSIERPGQHPASAYFDWLLDHAGELLVKIESRELAAQFYLKAAKVFNETKWRSSYYEGIAYYETAEYWFEQDDSIQAINFLERTIRTFEGIPSQDKSGNVLAEKVKIGVNFRISMAEARKYMIMAVLKWNAPIITDSDSEEIQNNFKQSSRRYHNIQISDLELQDDPNYKKLSREEFDLVSAFVSLARVGLATEELNKSLRNREDRDSLIAKLGVLDTSIKEFTSLAKRTKSPSLAVLCEFLNNKLNEAYHDLQTSPRPVTAVIGNLIFETKSAFLKPLPTPAIECRLIGPGQANMQIYLKGAISGTGSDEDPYIFPSNRRLIFRIVVNVIQRARNEQLIVRDQNSITGKELAELIHIHEGSTALTVDYGLVPPAEAANNINFFLEFKNTGCSDLVQQERVSVRIYDSLNEMQSQNEIIEQQIKSKQKELSILKEDLRQLEEAINGHSKPVTSSAKLQVDEKRDQVKKIERELLDLQKAYEETRKNIRR